MNRVILDQTAFVALANLDHFAELCDPSGRVFGYFTPATDHSLYEGVEPPISDEGLDEIEKEPGGRTLAEIMVDLEKWA